jgi:hypothetical protein
MCRDVRTERALSAEHGIDRKLREAHTTDAKNETTAKKEE